MIFLLKDPVDLYFDFFFEKVLRFVEYLHMWEKIQRKNRIGEEGE